MTQLRQQALHQPTLHPPAQWTQLAQQAALLQDALRPPADSAVACLHTQAAAPTASRGFEAVTAPRVETGMPHLAAWAELAPRAAAEAGAGVLPMGVLGVGADSRGAELVLELVLVGCQGGLPLVSQTQHSPWWHCPLQHETLHVDGDMKCPASTLQTMQLKLRICSYAATSFA